MFFSREAKESRAQWAHWHKNQAALAARRAAKGLGPPRDGFYYCDACDALREQGTGPRRRCPVCRAE
jgi:rubrerythrin